MIDPRGDSAVSLLILERRKTDTETVSDLFKVTQPELGKESWSSGFKLHPHKASDCQKGKALSHASKYDDKEA